MSALVSVEVLSELAWALQLALVSVEAESVLGLALLSQLALEWASPLLPAP